MSGGPLVGTSASSLPRLGFACAALLLATPPEITAAAESSHATVGRVLDAQGAPVVGAIVTFSVGDPSHDVSVFTGDDGRYRIPPRLPDGPISVRVRRIGWRDLRLAAQRPEPGVPFDLRLERETDPVAVAAQLPANRWFALVLARIDDPEQREELKRQCTYCHQQGNVATRVLRSDE